MGRCSFHNKAPNELTMMMRLLLCSLLVLSATGFVVRTPVPSTSTALQAKRGFGKEEKAVKKEPSPGMLKRQAEANKYDEIAATGGQEYRIHIRQFGSDDSSWLPCGSIAVPRDGQVANAIKANVDALKSAIVRTYPKLKGREEEFEFGYNLKIYPDDPIEVANLGAPLPQQGFSFGNWVSTLLSPVDTSGVPPPPIPDEK